MTTIINTRHAFHLQGLQEEGGGQLGVRRGRREEESLGIQEHGGQPFRSLLVLSFLFFLLIAAAADDDEHGLQTIMMVGIARNGTTAESTQACEQVSPAKAQQPRAPMPVKSIACKGTKAKGTQARELVQRTKAHKLYTLCFGLLPCNHTVLSPWPN
eukprot:1138012-Pelagomonas_calceolata.AAC.5